MYLSECKSPEKPAECRFTDYTPRIDSACGEDHWEAPDPTADPPPTPRHVPAWRSQDLILTRPRAETVISKGECIKCSSVVQKETIRLSLIKYLFLCIFYNVHSRAFY